MFHGELSPDQLLLGLHVLYIIAVDSFCKTSNDKLKQKIKNRGMSLFGNDQVKASSPYIPRGVRNSNPLAGTKTDSLTIVYQEDGDAGNIGKKRAGKKVKCFMLQQRKLASDEAGNRSLQQLIKQNTGMLNLYRYWVAWSLSKNACGNKKNTNANVHEFLFGQGKDGNK